MYLPEKYSQGALEGLQNSGGNYPWEPIIHTGQFLEPTFWDLRTLRNHANLDANWNGLDEY